MAIEQQIDLHNCRPPSSTNKTGTLRYGIKVAQTSEDDDGNTITTWVTGGERSISGIIKNVWNEVGDGTHSSFSGIDSNGNEIKAVTNGVRCENMYRYNIMEPANDDWVDDDDLELTDDTGLLKQYVYTQGRKEVSEGNKSVGRYEYYCRPEYSYEEQYFSHIYNWPTSHATVPRKIACLVEEQITEYATETDENDGETQVCTSTVSYAYHEASTTYPEQDLTLAKTQSKLYFINDDWTYSEILLNSDGTINNSAYRDKIGNPYIYHAGTDDRRKLLFNYTDTGSSTTKVLAIGDTVAGATVTNVINYVINVALKRNASIHSNKRQKTKGMLSSTDPGYADTKGWVKLNSIRDINVGDKVWGSGIAQDTLVTAVDISNSIAYLSKTVRKKKLKKILFGSDNINRVDKATVCYAEFNSDLNLGVDSVHEVTRISGKQSFNIIARAGAGIPNRSGIVGTYFSEGKKEVEYLPIFYSADQTCEKITESDNNGEYVFATRIYEDNSRESDLFVLIKPKTKEAYQIGSIYMAATNGPIDKEGLEKWLKVYQQENNWITVFNGINEEVKQKYNGKRVAGTVDSACGDLINMEFSQVYFPIEELDILEKYTGAVGAEFQDYGICEFYTPPSEQGGTFEEQKEKVKQIIDNAVSSTSLLSEDYYKRLVSNDDSLLNRINKGIDATEKAKIDDTKIKELPPQIEGQDSSGRVFRVDNYRELPPAMNRVKFFMNDLVVGTEKDFNPQLDLDPETTHNQPKIIVASVPVWTGANNHSETITVGQSTVTISANVNTQNFNGTTGIDTITTSVSGPTPATVTIPDPPPLCPPGSYTVYNYSILSPNNNSDTILKDHRKDFAAGGYVTGTNWHVHPDLRDLDNKCWPDEFDTEENDFLHMTGVLHPKILWRPNVNYQRDYHKMFWFRPNEISDLIGQTIENNGNPYQDDPVIATITDSIGETDTVINVNSTRGFLSSGYLIIPKYIKKLFTLQHGNQDSIFTYYGEEIIYYQSKTKTTFQGCIRNCFDKSSKYPTIIPVSAIEAGTKYKINTLGDTDWQSLGAKKSEVGHIFTATKDGDNTGIVKVQLVFEWDDDPDNAGLAAELVTWSGSNIFFEQDGSKEKGRQKRVEEVSSGTYDLQFTGTRFKVSDKKIKFYDGDGNDTNAKVTLEVKDTFGQDIDVKFNENGDLVVTGDGAGSGDVTVVGQTDEEIPSDELVPGMIADPLLASISSYDAGFGIAQHWIYRTRE